MNRSKVDRISIITNDGKTSPRYWNVTPKRLYFIFWGIPFIMLLLSAITAFSLYHQEQLSNELKEVVSPKKYKALEEKYFEGLSQINEHKDNISALQTKLTSGEQESLDTLSLFRVTKGIKDLTHTPPLTLEVPKLLKTPSGVELRFNLVNITTNGKRAQGHLFILLRDQNNLQSWPANTFKSGTLQINYTKGEYFATSRFRPVSAKFKTKNSNSNLLFKVLVFSTSGDLILKRILSIKAEQ